MSECRWKYYDPQAGQQYLGLFHGDKSGHLMIYHNHQVVIIDFKVTSDRSYSYLANNHIHTFNVIKNMNDFSYRLDRVQMTKKKSYSEPFSKLFSLFF